MTPKKTGLTFNFFRKNLKWREVLDKSYLKFNIDFYSMLQNNNAKITYGSLVGICGVAHLYPVLEVDGSLQFITKWLLWTLNILLKSRYKLFMITTVRQIIKHTYKWSKLNALPYMSTIFLYHKIILFLLAMLPITQYLMRPY